MDFTKFSEEELGKAYKEIVGYNPFQDNEVITIQEVSDLMNDYDKEVHGTPYPEFSDWFADGPSDPPDPETKVFRAMEGGTDGG